MNKRIGFGLALCLVAFTGTLAQQAPKPLAPDGFMWATSWDDAIKEAKERNVPIYLTLHKDN